MDNNQGTVSCAIGCWLVAALAGFLAAVLLWLIGSWSFLQGAFMGAVVFVVAGLLLNWIMCRPLPALGEAQGDGADDDASAKPASAKSEATPAPAAKSAPAPAAEAVATTATTAAAAPKKVDVKPSKPLAGQDELSERKGEWKYEGDAADAAETDAGGSTVQRDGAFVATAEGFHGLGREIAFPDIGVAGYLGGFICEAEMTIDGAQAFRRTLRRPYGRSAAVANVTSTERLAPGRYAVNQQVACRPDGRHGADAEPALRQITLRSLVRRPDERSAHPAAAADFGAR